MPWNIRTARVRSDCDPNRGIPANSSSQSSRESGPDPRLGCLSKTMSSIRLEIERSLAGTREKTPIIRRIVAQPFTHEWHFIILQIELLQLLHFRERWNVLDLVKAQIQLAQIDQWGDKIGGTQLVHGEKQSLEILRSGSDLWKEKGMKQKIIRDRLLACWDALPPISIIKLSDKSMEVILDPKTNLWTFLILFQERSRTSKSGLCWNRSFGTVSSSFWEKSL